MKMSINRTVIGLGTAGLTLLTTNLSGAEPQKKENQKRMNVIFVLTDDQGYGDLGCTGNPYLRTPNIDAFSEQSVVLDRYMVSAVSAPTRASLLTGRYHIATGCNWVTGREEVLNEGETTFAEIFRAAGYRTGIFGKWHNGAQYPHNPIGQGFDEFFGFCLGHINNYFDPILEDSKGVKAKRKGYIADIFTDKAIKFIKKHKNEPFFCYVPYNTPHGPLQVPSRYFDYYKSLGLDKKLAATYGMCENIDDNFGRILETVEKEGLTDNTIIIFTTDNGPASYRYNAGMKGKKAEVHEGGVRVPFFIHIPGQEPRTVNQLTAHVDFLPTIASLCDVPVPDSLDLHGRDITPLIQGNDADWEDRAIFTHNQPWRKFEEYCAGAIRTEQYRLVYSRKNEKLLYDMIADPEQKHDIYQDSTALVKRLHDRYDTWFKAMTANGVQNINENIRLGYKESPNTSLPSIEAKLYNTRFSGEGWSNDWAEQIKDNKASIRWTVDVVADSDYKVSVLYRCEPGDKGTTLTLTDHIGDTQKEGAGISAQIRDARPAKRVKDHDREARGEAHEYIWRELKLGEMSLTKGQHTLELNFPDITSGNNLKVFSIEMHQK